MLIKVKDFVNRLHIILNQMLKEQILKALSKVEDPDLKKDLVSLNMINEIKVDDHKIYFTVILTTPACPLKELIKSNCIKAIEEEIGSDYEIHITMTSVVTSTRSNAPLLPGVKNIIAIASGKGGVGKSTVTSNLAVALAQSGARVGIIDADISGPSIPVMFGCELEKPEMVVEDGKNYIIPIERFGVKLISIGFLTPADGAVVWRGPMASSALKQFISDCKWGELDYLLIDLPPGTSDIHLTLVQTLPVTGAIIVTTPQKVALADAQKGLNMFTQPQINVPVLGIVENMAYFTPLELPNSKYYIFGKDGGKMLSDKYGIDLLGQIPIVQSIREAGDAGKPVVLQDEISSKAFMDLSESVAQKVAIRNATKEKTNIVEIRR